jgi:hypothetical protein
MVHKMRMDMSKLLQADTAKAAPTNMKNTQVNVYGEGNYGALMEQLLKRE